MNTAYLFRFKALKNCTIGIFIANGKILYSLEPAWRDNERNISCIPKGEYDCHFMARSSSGKYRNVYHVKNVSDRSGILIHNGNIHQHTKGCILLGTKEGVLGGQPAVLASRSAMNEIVRIMNKQPFKLKVI